MIVGLTGGYCTGKSELAALLAERGWINVEMDAMGHRALENRLDLVESLLGRALRLPDGRPDRKAIGALVFSDAALLERYEAIIHPEMVRLCDRAIDQALGADGSGRVLVNAALLYRLPQVGRCELVLEVRAPLLLRLRRSARRDGLSVWAALRRIASQRKLWKLGRCLGKKRRIVRNAGSRAELERQARAILDTRP
ncbi:MAG TPA: dephospho-CoA kinase [Spirochaetales bacterium]|nr:dephospho-CoA kinase [Spirochaetales bacterium]